MQTHVSCCDDVRRFDAAIAAAMVGWPTLTNVNDFCAILIEEKHA